MAALQGKVAVITGGSSGTIRYRLATTSMGRVRRTVTLSETRGVMKALIDAESDEILGFTAFGTDAGEMMSVVRTAMLARLPYTAVRDAIFAHPTMAEDSPSYSAQLRPDRGPTLHSLVNENRRETVGRKSGRCAELKWW